MLASDLNNPEFSNPVNPDDLMHIEFYWYEPIDSKASREAGKVIRSKRTPYVRIMRPGDKTSIIETPVREDHKGRWPQKWLYFQMQEGLVDVGKDIPGWNIDTWDELNDEQKKGLKYLNFHVVEQIAGASDAQVQNIGMGGLGLREKARHALKSKMDAGIRAEIASKDSEIAELKESNKRLESKFDQLLEKLNNTPVKRKYSKKVKHDNAQPSPTNL
jgi:hypothetical protein